ncbi:NAD(P)-dependent oxidoreductase [Mycetocola tolaasinivorans]|uniref:NAD(P)-dependent oxidoreductase n=1 Tax=Mycetocola tolaasinivorans TaxID=76635 RepID=UPI001C7CD9BC|nr:NAD(P)-dependent oxidoreductase [Mycetocola tolaasinivorans]
MPGKILVTPRSLTAENVATHPLLEPLRAAGYEIVAGPAGRQPEPAELRELVADIEGWVAGVEPIDAETLAAAPHLRVISRNGAGADAIDLAAASARGIRVETARGANARGVAELALGLILGSLRQIPAANSLLHDGGWARARGREVAEVTVGIVGFGAIGRHVASTILQLGGRVVAYDPFVTEDTEGVELVNLPTLFRESNVVTLHAPPPADGTPLVGRDLLALMPAGSVLINTARSALVDHAAVLDAYADGTLISYAVDAFATEPPELDATLSHPHTLLTPHIGAFTGASTQRAAEAAVENLLAALTNQ